MKNWHRPSRRVSHFSRSRGPSAHGPSSVGKAGTHPLPLRAGRIFAMPHQTDEVPKAELWTPAFRRGSEWMGGEHSFTSFQDEIFHFNDRPHPRKPPQGPHAAQPEDRLRGSSVG